MPHVSDPIDAETSVAKPGHAFIARRTWDRYFLIAALAAGLVGSLSWWASGSARHLGSCTLLLGLWLVLRWGWPAQGQQVPSIPRAQRWKLVLACGFVWFLLLMILGAELDRLTFPRGRVVTAGRGAVRPMVFVGWFGLLVGSYFVGRWYWRRGARGR